jgi:hypothetical protein
MMMTLNLMSSHNPWQMRCFFYPQSSGWAILALQLNVSNLKYVVGCRCTFFHTYIFVFLINAHDLLKIIFPIVSLTAYSQSPLFKARSLFLQWRLELGIVRESGRLLNQMCCLLNHK